MTEIVLALGGGGVKGIAHIGVIRQLEKLGFKIKAVAGTSAGGMVGAVYAAGLDPQEILGKLLASRRFSRSPQDGPSLLGLQEVAQVLVDALGSKTFEQLNIPFACTAVDIKTAREYVLNRERIVDAVLATIAVPGVFPPHTIGNLSFMDGGVLDPVPVALARWLAPDFPVIAVCLSSPPDQWANLPDLRLPGETPIPVPILEQFAKLRITQAFNIFTRSIDITSRMVGELRMQVDQPDVIIRPAVDPFGILDNVDPDILIRLGEEAVQQALPEITKAFSWKSKLLRKFKKADRPAPPLPTEIVSLVPETPIKP